MNKILYCALLLPLLTACGGGKEVVCSEKNEPYLTSRNNVQLKVPDGMTQPNRSEALAIPESKPVTRKGTACLDEPPSYFRSAGTTARSPEEVVASWAQAWANREADAVVALYSSTFTAPTDSAGSAAWLEQRREQVATGPVPDSVVEGLRVEPAGDDRRIVQFVQKFGTNSLRKELTLVREGASWRIVAEKVAEVK
ncbi:hypothetical protein [Steroidobacter sp.]|uniref:hypothetical protein n=1 Tax=Steroidobacter sp. TaxID=1978227 RepID=UPI0025EEA993|nr:hypothetical protein [Steroidobacter sp.]